MEPKKGLSGPALTAPKPAKISGNAGTPMPVGLVNSSGEPLAAHRQPRVEAVCIGSRL